MLRLCTGYVYIRKFFANIKKTLHDISSDVKCRVHGLNIFASRSTKVTSKFLSPHGKVRQTHNTNLCTKSCIFLTKLKYFLVYQNYIHGVIRRVINSRNACCQSLRVALSSRFLSRDRDYNTHSNNPYFGNF